MTFRHLVRASPHLKESTPGVLVGLLVFGTLVYPAVTSTGLQTFIYFQF